MTSTANWTLDEAERYLLGLELFGMRFGLDRMRRLMTTLDQPERRFDSIHVVGTNGKSSTVRMTAAILQRHGLRAGAYLSPHLVSFTERMRVDDVDTDAVAFAKAVQRAAHAAALVDRSQREDDRVTQFEALTAAAFSELAARKIDVAVIEAGLGGRYDATNVLPSTVQVLTNVGLEHTRWLGPTVRDIAREKLAVVRDGGTLVVGADLHPDAFDEAQQAADRHGAKLIVAPAEPGVEVAAPGTFQRRNFALARAAADAYLAAEGRALDLDAVRSAAGAVMVPGRMQVAGHEPLTVLDGAHNPAGIEAIAESLPQLTAGRRLVAVVSVLDDKDAAAMLRALLPHCEHVVFTRNHSPRALPPATLASLASQLDGPPSELETDPRRALARARELAGAGGVVLATGSIYLVADLLRPAGQRNASIL
ncbi:bifunctional folylpolyglutamate synthase/dihydrofolate synthase [Conexibacter woesei]|uniref:tetrahydrofolate synthase n=1 Tax=Conexibacter woesei (strain DSM 14684 / CCUG 47730 / CIP 108061 / JCM 11494 / NBRC 100937 / ID131577) TaxID=469383 RepID=D3F9L0_CONWI|nr:cyanophycin synthetase [Conexibacter woesei]ADB51072.1 FolC bifunctional protein [Conexibacter woesei DSM 14684]